MVVAKRGVRSVDYLGHKRGLLDVVLSAIEDGASTPLRVADLFSGTAVVSRALRERGHLVHANDHLELCATWARAALAVPANPVFAGMPRGQRSYAALVDALHAITPHSGFVTRHFSPRSAATGGVERRYFTVQNAQLIDGARRQIEMWRPDLTAGEHALLLSALVAGAVGVSNTAGTYGCYLKAWKPSALLPLRLRPLPLAAGSEVGHDVTCADATEVATETPADVAYADPPYTKRQYAAYYHVLETLVRDDDPVLTGTTGLRDWTTHASDWCYRRRAPEALERLVAKTAAPRLVLSYNEDGQIRHDEILEIMGSYGEVAVREASVRRYRSSALPHKGPTVIERIYTLDRA